ncbi:bacterial transferase hexapeptide family protein [Delftia acidovorans]|uniref:UDP-3-O-(3-hydroxymyristoyl)glucosamine N-acyltransferase n=1 Tax=Delftia acidovorans TaxID=80866 RepID=UPI00050247D9|nr:UDP-3-O-(3-hydroxymyristoyl)glucosamine N-acyltransferase [Delftia acidovorans]KFJ13951.1 bacterial transferase hexapeptide family protein [Delftia acidovorans]QQB49750.1 UDP-3-O-(3-hydroxymyristoyl)glucosamine N-acyltransferase [Delftia acidovorans]
MKYRWIVGCGDFLDTAFHAWKQFRPDELIKRVEVRQNADYAFDCSVLDTLDPAKGSAFIAFNERFGNFKRLELMQAAVDHGLNLEPFISPMANVATDVVIGPNSFIGHNACIGHGSRIDFNTVIHNGVQIGIRSTINASCWIESGVQVGDNVEIGAHGILRMGAMIKKGITVGEGCELGWPRLYHEDIPSKTVFDLRYDEPIYVYPGT